MSLVEKETLLKAIQDPSFAKGPFSDLTASSFTEEPEYREIYNTIREHYRLEGLPLTERSLLNQVEDRLVRRKMDSDKLDQHLDIVHDLYTIEQTESDDDVVNRRINEFVRSKMVYNTLSKFVSDDGFGDEESLNKLVPELQKISTMNVSGDSGVLIDFFEDTELKKEYYQEMDSIKFPTGFGALDRLSDGGIGRGEVGMILGSTGSGKCITGDSLVTTEKGLLHIQDIPGHFHVDKETGESEAYVASYTTDGEYTPRNTSHWYNMGYSQTIKIRTARGVEIEGTPEHPLLALNREGKLEFIELQDMVLGEYITLAKPNMWSDKDLVDADTAYMTGLNDGMTQENEGKGIFNLILQSSKEINAQYIKGIINSAGFLNESGTLTIRLAQHQVAKELQTVMLNMGVLAKREIIDNVSILKLYVKDTAKLFKEVEIDENDFYIMSPVEYSVSMSDFMQANYAAYDLPKVGFEVLEGLDEEYVNQLHENFIFDSISSFELSEAVVYDFTVPETHSFVANGIVSHNTTWAVQQLNNYTKSGLNTLYIALEENLGRMLLKVEQNMLGVSRKDLFDIDGNLREDVFEGAQELYKNQINLGRMFISKHHPQEVTISDIEQIILDVKFRKGIELDAVIIDYPDLMKNHHARGGDNESEAGGKLLEDVRRLAQKHNYVCWVLGQLNRSGWGQDIRTAESIEGSKRKLNAVELAVTLNQTDEEFERGLLRLHIDKVRYQAEEGFSRIQYFKLEREGLRIRDESPEEIEIHKALVGDDSSSTYNDNKQEKSNKAALDRINSINQQVGGGN